ncbi:IS66 family insertion sequence element accessory protein TnpB [Mesorhizobium sp. WSM1293]|uniref:IS66 family insertion sequence element accessory protein TnpB n=1 Tax=Mesorhizobium sp. WSM1293 TaxID=1040984 RepID=UPI00048913F8|nr:IS66 family insertion sequence element accessory protein TnpB [Mesorhizobium sp. WSM1293]
MRKGFPGLALMVQDTLKRDPHAGHLFCFRGRQGGLVKVIWRMPQKNLASELGGMSKIIGMEERI